jgi:protein gp37
VSANTAISWADDTFNPWWGCARVSPACRFCYAADWAKRTGHPELWHRHGVRRLFGEKHWQDPLKLNARAEREGRPRFVFCASMADVFEDHPALPPERDRLWGVIGRTPSLVWLLLTKRPENVMRMVPWDATDWPANAWIGASAETQRWADRRIPFLLQVPAPVRFLSCEPLLGPIDLLGRHVVMGQGDWEERRDPGYLRGIGWIIAGGESGRDRRVHPTHPEWARSLRDQAVAAGVPFHWKQWGEWAPVPAGGVLNGDVCLSVDGERFDVGPDYVCASNESDGEWLRRVGKKRAGRELDGQVWDERPPATVTVGAAA